MCLRTSFPSMCVCAELRLNNNLGVFTDAAKKKLSRQPPSLRIMFSLTASIMYCKAPRTGSICSNKRHHHKKNFKLNAEPSGTLPLNMSSAHLLEQWAISGLQKSSSWTARPVRVIPLHSLSLSFLLDSVHAGVRARGREDEEHSAGIVRPSMSRHLPLPFITQKREPTSIAAEQLLWSTRQRQ
eukprot:862262-Pelagomonas_calceolata.AAC.2